MTTTEIRDRICSMNSHDDQSTPDLREPLVALTDLIDAMLYDIAVLKATHNRTRYAITTALDAFIATLTTRGSE
jgi:hypothetical protein